MLYSEEAVRANIRNRDGKRVFYLGKGDQLTSSARDYLSRERIEILPAEQAKPQCYRLLNGGYVEEKPEHMTHLHGDVLVSKNHPRIVLRGKMDTLESELILCQLADKSLEGPVGEILGLARQIIRCEVLGEELKWDTLCGLTESEQRKRSHFPQEYYGQPHFMPSFSDREGNLTRQDIPQALNRMSSMLYLLMIQRKAAK